MLFSALIQVSACVADIICIAQITLKTVYNALLAHKRGFAFFWLDILTCDFTSYMQNSIRFFRLKNDLREIETSSNYFASCYLKMCFEETSY